MVTEGTSGSSWGIPVSGDIEKAPTETQHLENVLQLAVSGLRDFHQGTPGGQHRSKQSTVCSQICLCSSLARPLPQVTRRPDTKHHPADEPRPLRR